MILASTQSTLVALFLFTGIPLYYTFVTGWPHFPGLVTVLNVILSDSRAQNLAGRMESELDRDHGPGL
jgi:hypothetical protein